MLRLMANAATESHEWVSGPDTLKVHADVCSWCYHQTLRTGPVPPLATAGSPQLMVSGMHVGGERLILPVTGLAGWHLGI